MHEYLFEISFLFLQFFLCTLQYFVLGFLGFHDYLNWSQFGSWFIVGKRRQHTLMKRSSAASAAGPGAAGNSGSAMLTGSSDTATGSVGGGLDGGVTTPLSLEDDDDDDGSGSDVGDKCSSDLDGKDDVSGGNC